MASPKHVQLIAEIRDHLAGLLEKTPASAPTAGKILRLLGQLEKEAAKVATEAAGVTVIRARGPRRTETVSHYRVEAGQRGDRSAALAEHRTSGAQPFRCPWEIYEAGARELAEAGGGVGFDDLHARVQRRLGDELPIYRLRMCLRFWEAAGIIEHWLKEFRPSPSLTKTGFVAATKKTWERAREEAIRPRPPSVDAYHAGREPVNRDGKDKR